MKATLSRLCHNHPMEITVNYSYELNLSSNQRHQLSQTAGATRCVWNLFVAKQIEIKKERDRIYRDNKERSERGLTLLEQPRYLTFSEMSRELTALKRKPETQWLKEPIAQALQQALRNLSHAVDMSFRNSIPATDATASGCHSPNWAMWMKSTDGFLFQKLVFCAIAKTAVCLKVRFVRSRSSGTALSGLSSSRSLSGIFSLMRPKPGSLA